MDQAASRPAFGSPATFPERGRSLFELLVVVGLLESELWHFRSHGPAWLNVLIYGLIVGIAWSSHERRRRATAVADAPKLGAWRSWFEVGAAVAVLSIALIVVASRVGDANETFEFVFLDKPPARLLGWLVGKFGAALLQQLALQLFLWPVCREITGSRLIGMFLAAATFGLIHLPSPTLVAITALAGSVWVAFYRRTGRLAPLVASHMILATLAHGALPERLTYDMRVGQTATADLKRFDELNDPRIRVINRRLKENRASLKFYASEPYYDAQGGTLPGLVRGLFRDVLGREATKSDVRFWVGRRMANPRVDLVNILMASDEYAAILQARRSEAAGDVRRR